MTPNGLFPNLRIVYERRHVEVYHLYQVWRQERADKFEQWQPENVRFVHDPEWKNRFWSVQCAHDGNHWFWKTTHEIASMMYARGVGVAIFG